MFLNKKISALIVGFILAVACFPAATYCDALASESGMPSGNNDIIFTAEEQEFISQNENVVFTALMNPDRRPVSYFEDGKAKGIVADLAQLAFSRANLKYTVVETPDRAAYERAKGSRMADVLLDAVQVSHEASEYDYTSLDSSVGAEFSMLYRRNLSGKPKSYAAVYNSNWVDAYREGTGLDPFGGAAVTYYNSIAEVVEAVLHKKQDAAILETTTASYVVYNNDTGELVYKRFFALTARITFAVYNSQDVRLRSILNKTFLSLLDGEYVSIVTANTTYASRSISFKGFLYQNTIAVIIGIFAIITLTVSICVVIMTVRVKNKTVIRVADEKLKNTALAQALRAAEQADKAKSAFTSRISHELRTPLTAIIGYMDLSKDAEHDYEKLREYRQKSETAAKQLLSIINDVLESSALESGQAVLNERNFDLKELCISLENMFFAQAEVKAVKFKVDMRGVTNNNVYADDVKLTHILTNLLSNAIKFTPADGSVALTVTERQEPEGFAVYRFKVSDTGIGMDEAFINKIGTPFQQETAEIGRTFGGSGLGVSIVKMLVSLMNSKLKIESVKGKGSTFTVDVPMQTSDEHSAKTRFTALRVLVADNSETNCKDALNCLTKYGIRAEYLTDGRAALIAVRNAKHTDNPFDLCIIDWRLGYDDELNTIQAIDKYYPDAITMVATVNQNSAEVECEVENTGATLLMEKPLTPSSVHDMLTELYGGSEIECDVVEKPEEKSYNFSGRRVLLVEDNEMNMEISTKLISKTGMEVVPAENGQLALERFAKSEKGCFDVILMDVQMPVMNGLEATRKIRALKRSDAAAIPIFALTADTSAEDIAVCVTSGMNDHISKPVNYGELFALMNKYFEAADELKG